MSTTSVSTQPPITPAEWVRMCEWWWAPIDPDVFLEAADLIRDNAVTTDRRTDYETSALDAQGAIARALGFDAARWVDGFTPYVSYLENVALDQFAILEEWEEDHDANEAEGLLRRANYLAKSQADAVKA